MQHREHKKHAVEKHSLAKSPLSICTLLSFDTAVEEADEYQKKKIAQ
jgi:hypothetical protein